MGNPSPQPGSIQPIQSSSSINHFSHPHPLQLLNQSPKPSTAISCSGCRLDASGGLVYTCTICNYFLHQECSKMPQQITHPCDPNHVLSLLPKPIYPEGMFNCDACGLQGKGFSYHCQSCTIDLHILCATKPMTLVHQSHQHQLNLTFTPPYPTKSFSCDSCKMPGSNHWLYRCDSCEFDVHLTCTSRHTNRPPVQQTRSIIGPQISQQNMYSIRQASFQQPTAYVQPQIQQTLLQNRTISVQPQSQQTLLQNRMIRPNYPPSNPHLTTQNTFPNSFNPVSYSPYSSGGMMQPQAQVYAATPYTTISPMQQSFYPMNNFTNTGGAYGYNQQNTLMNQMAVGMADGIASGASQAITGAFIQNLMGGNQGGGSTNPGGYSDNFQGLGNGGDTSNPGGVSHLQDFGGANGDMINGYVGAPDGISPMSQDTYGLGDSGYDQNQMDAGIMEGEMNQMMDVNQLDSSAMVGGDMSQMQVGMTGSY